MAAARFFGPPDAGSPPPRAKPLVGAAYDRAMRAVEDRIFARRAARGDSVPSWW